MAGKTPVTLLQEISTRKNWTPQYEQLPEEGDDHARTFRFSVSAGECTGNGAGPTKKAAKHSAALDVLRKLADKELILPQSLDDVMPVPSSREGVEGNPVGDLQEFCLERQCCIPKFDVISEEGPPHEKKFEVEVTLGKLKERGKGSSKKMAKRIAANKLMKYMKTLSDEELKEEIAACHQDETENENNILRLRELCLSAALPEPVFIELDQTGPDHSPSFTIQCVVGQQKQVAVAGGKKAAKKKVAQQMLETLRGSANDQVDQ